MGRGGGPDPMMGRWGPALAGLLLAASPAAAQVVRGTVLEARTDRPVVAATVTALDRADSAVVTAVTDTLGRFRLAPGPGAYRLSVTRLGYTPTTTQSFALGSDDDLDIEIRLSIEPFWLGSVRAVAEARVPALEAVGFYTRARKGFGHFMIREQVERRAATRATDLFYGLPAVRLVLDSLGQPRVRMRKGLAFGACAPTLVLDDFPVDGPLDQVVHPAEIEAIEVYPGVAGAPIEYARNACGVVMVWTRK